MDKNKIITNSIQTYSIASVIFGVIALFTFFTGIIPLFAGSMGIVFVVLSYRKGAPLTSTARLGLLFSFIGIIFGVSLLIYSYCNVVVPMMNDPEYYAAMDQYYRNNFGVSLDELFQGFPNPSN